MNSPYKLPFAEINLKFGRDDRVCSRELPTLNLFQTKPIILLPRERHNTIIFITLIHAMNKGYKDAVMSNEPRVMSFRCIQDQVFF